LSYMITYAIGRSIIEHFRGDKVRKFVIDDVLSTSQFISILVAIGVAFFLVYRLRQVKESDVK